jgi:peptide/nickel transport system permease protein
MRAARLRSALSILTSGLSGKVGFALTVAFLLVAILAPLIAPYAPIASSGTSFAPPSWKHFLGTDDIGEDIFSQLIFAIRGSVEIGVFAGLIASLVGASVGLLSGYYGGWLDEVLMRLTDAVLAVPTLVLLLTIAAYTNPNASLVVIIIGLLSWPWMARVVRSQTISLRHRPFIESSRMSGMRDREVIVRVILPNELPLVILYGVLAAVSAIVLESGFDLIGVGSLNNLSLGVMLYFAFKDEALLRGAWWWFLPPGLVIGLFGTGLLLLGYNVERFNRMRS